MMLKYPNQKLQGKVGGYSDSDWAGCRRTAKSTSGGALMYGRHPIKTLSITQKSVALSLAEAELIAAVKTSTELIGLLQLMRDWGRDVQGEVKVGGNTP